jgi:shikimate kinase
MSGYYDYSPQIELSRPTVIISYLSSYTRAVAYRASSLLGLRFFDIDRLVEHEAAMEVSRLVAESGEASYREIESRCLERALGEHPAGLIALGDGGLLDEANRQRVNADGQLIVLDFELGNLLWRVQQAAGRLEKAPWHPLYWEAPAAVADLRPFYQERRAAFDGAAIKIPAHSLSVAEACDAMMQHLGA